jgi:putative tryptophan/tyrosine transport system substrate-binding protein
MKRRAFITLLGGAAGWPLAMRAQPSAEPVIGVVRIAARGKSKHLEEAFREGLQQGGYVENQNIAVEWRWAEGHNERIPGILADLVARQVTAIAALGGTAVAQAAKAATKTIPIVFMMGGDPVDFGLVASLARPGANITGVAMLNIPVIAKRLDLLHQLLPRAQTIALLVNPTNPRFAEAERRETQSAAQALGLQLYIANAQREDEIASSFSKLTAQGVGALLISADAYFFNQFDQISALASRYAIPAIAQFREYPTVGGLMSYGNDIPDAYREAGAYMARVLKGKKPAEMPVMQPTKFQLVINLKTAKALGLAIPATLLALADDVID